MKYLKSLALLLLSLSILASCSQDEYFEDVYSKIDTEANVKDTKAMDNDINDTDDDSDTEPNDTTQSGTITIIFEEPEIVDLECEITLP